MESDIATRSPFTDFGGHVHFTRQDGPAHINISRELTADAAIKLDSFLRDLLAADAPRLEAIRSEHQAAYLAKGACLGSASNRPY